VTSNSAAISGTVDPNGRPTAYHIEFGASKAYGHSTASLSAGAGRASSRVRVTVSGLRPRTIYHYRVVATSAGGTAVGTDRAFTTAKPAGKAPRFGFHLRARASARAALHGRLRVRFNCSKAC